jgi:hypothetical protein
MNAEDHFATVVPPTSPEGTRISTGISGLDSVLGGGLMPGRLYLVEGTPGAVGTWLGAGAGPLAVPLAVAIGIPVYLNSLPPSRLSQALSAWA